ncbi:MAG: hypothetical protein IKO72_13855 [Kiritimatiellae bacterium]|nr:hypothetical protein [Kiritimatiellia bacterium]
MYRNGRPVRQTFPLNLIIDDRPVLVVGGGQVGLRKVRSLLDAGARVELVSPDAVAELAELAAKSEGRLAWTKRPYAPGDAACHLLAFACTDDKHVNRAVLDDARKAHVPCCCSDMNWPDGDFTTPAIARMGDTLIAVSTSGQSCRSARDVKDEIVACLGERRNLQLTVLGTSDALLSSRRRAPFHLPAAERDAVGRLVTRVKGVREFFILNTCNRVELAVVSTPDADVIALLKRITGFDRLADGEYFALGGFEAFRHLVRVCAGLESSLLGEFHVVSQMKDAFAEAEEKHWSGPAIRFTAAETLRVAKLVRHAVEGQLRVAEIDQVAVRYLSVHGGLDAHTRVVVVGTGRVGTDVVRALSAQGLNITWIYHNRIPTLLDATDGHKATIVLKALDELQDALKDADIVLSAVDSAKPVVTVEMMDALSDRNVLMVDLGIPRNIDPHFDDCGHGITVADLDDLKLWHRVKTGTLNEILARADEVIRNEYKAML